MLMTSLFLLIILTKSTYYTFQNNSVLNFTHELNKNNKISFLDVLIDANNNNNFTTSTYKNPLVITPVPSTLKVNAHSDIKKQLFII